MRLPRDQGAGWWSPENVIMRVAFALFRRLRPCAVRLERSRVRPAERLEDRRLLAGSGPYGTHDYELLSRLSNGTWVATGISGGVVENQVVAQWNARAAWHLDQIGDFDGDDVQDIAARDATTGTWWTSLSDGVTSQTQRAGAWSKSLRWADVKTIDWDGDQRDDIVGRASNGKWYALISNGDGTFSNRLLGAWTASAGWTDTQWLDYDRDGDEDILSRSRKGTWQVGLNIAGFALENHVVGTWAAGTWKDVGLVDLEYDYRPEIVGRNARGEWWASKIQGGLSYEPGFVGTLVNHSIGSWDESQGWRDVQFGTAFTYSGGDKASIIGRNAAGEWWASWLKGWSLDDDAAAELDHKRIGQWDPAGKWRDVHVASSDGDQINEIIGRNAAGEWWSIDWPTQWSSEPMPTRQIAFMGDHRNIRSVQVGKFTWSPVSAYFGQLSIRAGRHGADVSVDDAGGSLVVSYESNGATITRSFARDSIDLIDFRGSARNDSFSNFTSIRCFASGLKGDDMLRGGGGYDYLDGGPGTDTLYGSSQDFFEGGEGIDQIDRGLGLVGDDSQYDPYKAAIRGSGDPSETSYNDIRQGAYGNCYFWATLGAAANAGVDLAANVRYKGGTSFEVKLHFKGVWNWVPTTFDWKTGAYDHDMNGDPILPHDEWSFTPEKDFWQLLYWRAWNKITNEGEAGDPATVFPYLTGLQNVVENDDVQAAPAESAIRSAVGSGHGVVTSTGGKATSTNKKGSLDPYGRVVANHAYTVVAVSTNGVTLFNPWRVDANWQVYDVDGQKGLSQSERDNYESTGVDGADDGVFQLSWEDWRRYFDNYTINPC